MDWTRQNKKAFREALQDVYREYDALEIFADEEFEVRLGEIAGNCSLQKAAYQLIQCAESQGELDELFEAFQRENPKHRFVLAIEEERSPTPSDPGSEPEGCGEVGGYLCQAPPVPDYFVPRPEFSDLVRDRLLSDEIGEPGTLVVSAIQGLGGIGKSVLAADLARQTQVRSRFPDGVLWVTLGQTPDLLKLLGSWITALGDREYSATTVDAASAYLRSLLADKTMLLVVDDLWNVADFKPFRLAGKGCRVLVTTREAKVPGIPERAEVRLGVMSLAEGRQLVEARLGTSLAVADLAVFETFAEKVEFLPLAFDLIASQVAEGYDWLTLLEDFQQEFDVLSLERSGCDEARRLLSLRACFNLSLRRLDREVLRRFAWLGVLPEDVAVDARMATVLWEVSPVEARRQLLGFLRRSLMLAGPKVVVDGRSVPTFRQHDLLHDLARDLLAASGEGDGDRLPGLGLTVAAAHGGLLDRYLPESGCWADLRDDGYIHGRLTWHMEQAERVREIHRLIRQAREDGRNGWYEACEELGQLTIFVEDVARAWRLAEETYGIIPREAEGWEWQMWCAFATVSLNSLVGNVPAELIAALVREGVWSEARGVAYAMQKKKESDRALSLAALVPHLESRELINQLVQESEAMATKGGWITASILEHHREVFESPISTAWKIRGTEARIIALASLVDIHPDLYSTVLQLAISLPELKRSQILACLSTKLHPSGSPKLVKLIRKIPDAYCRSIIALHLSTEESDLEQETFSAIKQISSEYSQANVLCDLSDRISTSRLHLVLSLVRDMRNEGFRNIALSHLSIRLPEIRSEIIDSHKDDPEKVSPDTIFLPLTLAKISEYQPEFGIRALNVIENVPSSNSRLGLLGEICSHLEPELLEYALTIIENEPPGIMKRMAISNLAKYLSSVDLLERALKITHSISDLYSLTRVLANLIDCRPDLLQETVEFSRSLTGDYGYRKTSVFIALAEKYPDFLEEAFLLTQAIENDPFHTFALSEIAPLKPEMFEELFRLVHPGGGDTSNSRVLFNLASHIPKSWLDKALDIARNIADPYGRAVSLSSVALQHSALWPEVIKNVSEIPKDHNLSSAIKNIAPRIPRELLPEILSFMNRIEDEGEWAFAVSGVAPRLENSLRDNWLEKVLGLNSRYNCAVALTGFHALKDWKALEMQQQNLPRLLASQAREHFMENIPNLYPHIEHLGGQAAVDATLQAMRDACQQWP